MKAILDISHVITTLGALRFCLRSHNAHRGRPHCAQEKIASETKQTYPERFAVSARCTGENMERFKIRRNAIFSLAATRTRRGAKDIVHVVLITSIAEWNRSSMLFLLVRFQQSSKSAVRDVSPSPHPCSRSPYQPKDHHSNLTQDRNRVVVRVVDRIQDWVDLLIKHPPRQFNATSGFASAILPPAECTRS